MMEQMCFDRDSHIALFGGKSGMRTYEISIRTGIHRVDIFLLICHEWDQKTKIEQIPLWFIRNGCMDKFSRWKNNDVPKGR